MGGLQGPDESSRPLCGQDWLLDLAEEAFGSSGVQRRGSWGRVVDGEVRFGQSHNAGHLISTWLQSFVTACDVLKVVPGRVLVCHLTLVLHQLHYEALISVCVSKNLLVVRDLPQLADVRGTAGMTVDSAPPYRG
ncbi:hypothetical protein INR49_008632 [Caranx melampygus]|nr:hypothetical protein INR49_008632 [Caranx melampygus]